MNVSNEVSNEPVSVQAAVTAALITTVTLLAVIFSWSEPLVAALNLCVVAWVTIGALLVRSRVVPVKKLEEYAASAADARDG